MLLYLLRVWFALTGSPPEQPTEVIGLGLTAVPLPAQVGVRGGVSCGAFAPTASGLW